MCSRLQGFNHLKYTKSYLRRKFQQRRMATEDEVSLLDQMRKVLGERDEVFNDNKQTNKQLMQGLKEREQDPNIQVAIIFIL
jgi:hypothetical protein